MIATHFQPLEIQALLIVKAASLNSSVSSFDVSPAAAAVMLTNVKQIIEI